MICMAKLGLIIRVDFFSILIIYIHIMKELQIGIFLLKDLKDCSLTIIADMNRAELGVRVNDISLGIICNRLPMGVPLYPAISPIGTEEIIEML